MSPRIPLSCAALLLLAGSESLAGERAWLELTALGVKIEVPVGAEARPGAGNSLMISAPDGRCTVMLAKKDDTSFFPSYDSVKSQIDKGTMGAMKEMLVDDKTDDHNWVIHYTRASITDPEAAKHAVDVRTKLGEDLYSCTRVTDTADDAACILAACKSLQAL